MLHPHGEESFDIVQGAAGVAVGAYQKVAREGHELKGKQGKGHDV